mmetsp:Transcript_45165/g.104656  ORF Transcript_45165/g.104656 Transcript_45165/m.104656 type:complete len:259 (+) Transcript_45165:44-820(+)
MGAGAGVQTPSQCHALTWYSDFDHSDADRGLDEEAWYVGGRYSFASAPSGSQPSCPLYGDVGCRGPARTTHALPPFLLLDVRRDDDDAKNLVGLVRSTRCSRSGWLLLEDADSKPLTLKRSRLANSWRKGAVYQTAYPCTLREGLDLQSRWLAELSPGIRVSVLKFGLLCEQDWERARLRMLVQVCAAGAEVGWLSPETADGYQLLSHPQQKMSTHKDLPSKCVGTTSSTTLASVSDQSPKTFSDAAACSPLSGTVSC